jgi:PAS domain S-box-containing protein
VATLPGALAWLAGAPPLASVGIAAANLAAGLWLWLRRGGAAGDRLARERLENLIRGSLQGIVIHRDHRPLFANQAYAEMFGFGSVDEVLALESLTALVAPHERQTVIERARDRLAGKPVPGRYEFQGVRRDGRAIWVETLAMAVPWDGAPAIQSTAIDITERKKAEEALRLSEVSHRALFEANRRILEHSPAGIILLDKDLRIVYENAGVRAMLGLGASECSGSIGLPLSQAAPFRNTPIANLLPKLAQGRRIGLETAFTNPGGEQSFLSVQAVPILEEERLTGAVVLATDVTERRRYEEALRKQELLLKALAEARSHLVSPLDLDEALGRVVASLGAHLGVDHVVIFANQGAEQARVSLRHEWCGEGQRSYLRSKAFEDISYRDSGFGRWHARLSAGLPINDRVPDLPPSERWLFESQQIRSVIGVPIFSGKLFWGFIGFVDQRVERIWSPAEEAILLAIAESLGHCIERRRAQERLWASEERFARMAAHIPGMVFECLLRPDGSRSYPYVSPPGLETLGLDGETLKLSAEPMLNAIHPMDRVVFERLFRESARTLQPTRWEGRFFNRTGEQRWAQVLARPMRQANGDILWDGLLLDITDRKRVELTLLLTRERDSTSAWSHELSEEWLPALRGIQQGLERLSEELRDGATPVAAASRLGEALRLTRQLLAWFQRARPVLPPIALSATLQEAIDLTLRGTDVEHELRIAPDIDRIAGDPETVREILTRLLVAALQALPEGGRIVIEARNVKVRGGGPAGLTPGHYVQVNFRDESRGVTRKAWRELLTPGPAASGLAEVPALVAAQQGWLTVQADPGKGPLFTLYLRAAALGLAPPAEAAPVGSGPGIQAS